MTEFQQNLIDTILQQVDGNLHWVACQSDGDITMILNDVAESVEKPYKRKITSRTKPKTYARYLAEIKETQEILERTVRERFLQYRKNHTVALLEFPLLKVKVEEGLRKRNIRHLFETKLDRNILTVHIINEYFFEIPITLENVDRTLGLVSYFIHRPEYAHEEMPEIRKMWSRQLFRNWDSLTARESI